MRPADEREPRFRLLRAQIKNGHRVLENVSIHFTGEENHNATDIEFQTWTPARGVFRYTVDQRLEPGEYAFVEMTDEGINGYVWDFGIDAPGTKIKIILAPQQIAIETRPDLRNSRLSECEVISWIGRLFFGWRTAGAGNSFSKASNSAMRNGFCRKRLPSRPACSPTAASTRSPVMKMKGGREPERAARFSQMRSWRSNPETDCAATRTPDSNRTGSRRTNSGRRVPAHVRRKRRDRPR